MLDWEKKKKMDVEHLNKLFFFPIFFFLFCLAADFVQDGFPYLGLWTGYKELLLKEIRSPHFSYSSPVEKGLGAVDLTQLPF